MVRWMFLADRRTSGCAYATVLRQSVVCRRLSVRNVLWLNGASRAKVTIDSL